ncbi:rhomboid family intramembrane serine protease [Nocardioides gilvus]|uniref:rhomboid family intramembrane serine protease n=1 Tax=Nocardioides gilvus TaxID=1735589 RepID=UPI000D74BC6B|nr:rhomboid family intramembrane serine protease [Nocardioides gilvus]
MRDASVGFQCPDCVARGAKETRSGQNAYGGKRSADPRLTTFVLIGLNALVWLAITLTGGRSSALAEKLMLSPAGRCVADDGAGWFPGVDTAALCATVPDAVWASSVADGAWWQVLTSGFTHLEIIHIALNMIGLWFVGPVIEQAIGRIRFLGVYFLSLFAGSASVLWLADPQSSTLGASGALWGLIGAMLLLAWRVGGNVRQLLILLAVNAVFTFTFPGISWQGHFGGLAGGLLAVAVVIYAPKGPHRSRWQVVGFVGLGVLIAVALAVRTLILVG